MTNKESPLFVHTRGTGASTVLLLHGGGVAGWMWKPMLEHAGPAHTFVIPDLPGHDNSISVPYRSHNETVQMLAAIVKHHTSEPVTVVGFSLGAQLAVLLAAHHPDLVRHAIVISAQAQPTPFQRTTVAMLRAAAPLARNERFARLQARELFVPDALMSDYLRTSRTLGTDTLVNSVRENISFTVPPGWTEFSGASHILVGAKERGLVKKSAEILADAHPRSELLTVDGCGHGIPLQRPDWLAQQITNWTT